MQDGPHRPEDQGRHRQGADGFPVLCGPATQGLHAYSPTATPIQAGNHQPQPPGHDRATQSTQWRGRCRGQGRPHRAGISRARDAQPEAHLQGGCATGPLPTHCTHPASIHRTRARATAKPAASAPRSGPWSDWPRLRPRMPCPHRDRGQHLVFRWSGQGRWLSSGTETSVLTWESTMPPGKRPHTARPPHRWWQAPGWRRCGAGCAPLAWRCGGGRPYGQWRRPAACGGTTGRDRGERARPARRSRVTRPPGGGRHPVAEHLSANVAVRTPIVPTGLPTNRIETLSVRRATPLQGPPPRPLRVRLCRARPVGSSGSQRGVRPAGRATMPGTG